MVNRILLSSACGGTGRTNLALNLSLELARRGKKTLLVELSAQGGLCMLLACDDRRYAGLADYFMGRVKADKAVKNSANIPGLSLLFRGSLDPVDEADFEQVLSKPEFLDGVLSEFESGFDFVILDAPSGMGATTRSALAVCDFTLVTTPAEPVGLRTLPRMQRLIQHVQEQVNPKLRVLGVVATQTSGESALDAGVLQRMENICPEFLNIKIPRSDVFPRLNAVGRPISLAEKGCEEATKALAELASLVIQESLAAPLGASQLPQQAESGSTHGYAHFDAAYITGASQAPSEVGLEEAFGNLNEIGHGTLGSLNWNSFLDTCLAVTGAESAFVLDATGLAVSSRGSLTTSLIQGMGTRLLMSVENAARMSVSSSGLRCILVEFDGLWMSGISVETAADETFVLGILGKEPVSSAARSAIRVAFDALLNRPFQAPDSLDELMEA